MDIIIPLAVILVFLVLKAFFSGSEIAMVNSDKLKLRHRAKLGDRGAKLVLRLFKTPDVILGTTLVGTNLATVTITTLGALICIDYFGDIGDLVSVLLLTPVLLIFGEIVPKSVFQQKANTIVGSIIYGLRFFSFLFYPVIFIFSRVARFAAKLVGGGTVRDNLFITREELRVLFDIAETGAGVTHMDRKSIHRIIRFADTTVGEAMIPLADVVGFNETRRMGQAVKTVLKHGYNRLPVYRGNLTNVKGVLTLSTWDLMDEDLADQPVTDFVTAPLYLTPKQTIDQTLPLLKARDDHMGIVVDEFGSAIGILTMEDVFEEVVGEIDVGYDFDEYQPKRRLYIEHQDEDTHLMGGRTPISEVNDILHLQLPVEEAHTIGGFVANRLRRIPHEGDAIEEQEYRITVTEADARSVLKVKMERM